MAKLLPVLAMLALLANSLADDTKPTTNAAPAAPTPPPAPVPNTSPTIALSNDVGIGSDGQTKDQDSYQVRIGELYAPAGESYIMPLRMPTLPDGQKFAAVHIRFQLMGVNNDNNTLANADLYALGVRDTNKALPADYYQGVKIDPKATLLQRNFLTPASKPRTDAISGPFTETSADGDAALAKVLNDACADPKNAGKFVFLRISYDADPIPDGNNAYMLLTTGANGDNEPPLITYTLTKK